MQVFCTCLSKEIEGRALCSAIPRSPASPGRSWGRLPGCTARADRTWCPGARLRPRCTDLRVSVHQHLLCKTNFHGVCFQPCPLLRGQKGRLRPALKTNNSTGLATRSAAVRYERQRPLLRAGLRSQPVMRLLAPSRLTLAGTGAARSLQACCWPFLTHVSGAAF